MEPLAGRLLLATPVIGDPNFARTVVLLLEHEEDAGTVGVVLNRPSELEVSEVLPAWSELASAPGVLHVGGPVAEGSALALALVVPGATASGWTPVLDRLAVVDLEADPDTVGAGVERMRVFTGYAGWGPGQLRLELAEQAWWVFDSVPDDWFSEDPAELWWAVLRRQGGRWKLWAHAPDDVSFN